MVRIGGDVAKYSERFDMEGRMRRCNVRIFPETTGLSSTASVNITEVLQLEKGVWIDHLHRSPGPIKSGAKPRTIVAKLHYYEDCVEVLRRMRTRGTLHFNGVPVAIFPDYTSNVAKAPSWPTGSSIRPFIPSTAANYARWSGQGIYGS